MIFVEIFHPDPANQNETDPNGSGSETLLSTCDHTFSKSKSREWVGYKRTREGLPGIMSEKSVKIVILFIPFFLVLSLYIFVIPLIKTLVRMQAENN